MNHKKFIKIEELNSLSLDILQKFNIDDVAIVNNPSYIYYPVEIYPLAPKIDRLKKLKAVVMDMDGTTTTTEPLCLHSLEYMVREITGKREKTEWTGLDREKDYPNVIGNSTTKHVEYLIRTYQDWINEKNLIKSYLKSVLWTLIEGQDAGRKEEVKTNLKILINGEIEDDVMFSKLLSNKKFTDDDIDKIYGTWNRKFNFNNNFDNIVRASIDIYYARYHFILKEISEGMHREEKLIKPMPGVAIYLALLSGLLGNEAYNLYDNLISELKLKISDFNFNIISNEKFKELGGYFEANPVKIGIVTSSILYEADIVLNEIFRIFREEVDDWGISKERKDKILEHFYNYRGFYNTIITASDSSEIRLKPHRDLYSIALHRLGIHPNDFDKVVGFEDSESGTISIRAAGIGLCVAVPFIDTNFHDFSAATKIVHGGLPEVLLHFSHWLDIL